MSITLLLFGLIAAPIGAASTEAEKPSQVDADLIACAPRTYNQALACLDEDLPQNLKNRLKSEGGVIEAYMGLGLLIRNYWGLWKRGPLAQSMEAMGFRHPDDMSAAILEGYSAFEQHKPYDVAAAGARSTAWWKAAAEQQKFMDKACATRRPVPVGDGTIAVCEWSKNLGGNVMYYEKQGN